VTPPIQPRYPVYIPSKGRATKCLTGRFLVKDGVDFRLVVEPQERSLYAKEFGDAKVLALPFRDLGLGSIPARNWIKQHALASGADRHWCIDDNIWCIRRIYHGKRIPCASGPALASVEDFVDRYENVAIAGLNYHFFVVPGHNIPPVFLNVHAYSCMLIRSDLTQEWRGRYNEDTDLCLQVLNERDPDCIDSERSPTGVCAHHGDSLAKGPHGRWVIFLVNWVAIDKLQTMRAKGGNTDELYKDDGRLTMARSLERMWPGVVTTTRRFKRPQHHIFDSWQRFDTQPRRRADVDFTKFAKANEYGMDLFAVDQAKIGPGLQKTIDEWQDRRKPR